MLRDNNKFKKTYIRKIEIKQEFKGLSIIERVNIKDVKKPR